MTQSAFVPWPLRLCVARVSTASRAELISHLDTALLPLFDESPGFGEAYRTITDRQELLLKRAGADGDALRAAGIDIVTRPNSTALDGFRVVRGDSATLCLNVSAVKRDNAGDALLLLHLEPILRSWAAFGFDPHTSSDTRPRLYIPVGDRLGRDRRIGWEIFDLGSNARVVFLVGSREIDTTQPSARDDWDRFVISGAKSRDDSVSRLVGGELNIARGGHWPHAEASLPRGWRFQREPMTDGDVAGLWRPESETRDRHIVAHHVEPDPETWWEAQVLIQTALDPDITTWKSLAQALGERGLRARGKDELGQPLHLLSDPPSAAKQALAPRKIAAYLTGKYEYIRRGPGGNVWQVDGGHRFTPRYPGDDTGTCTYMVNLSKPEWEAARGFTDEDLRTVLAKWWPDGASRPVPTGLAASDKPRRCLSGAIQWQDETSRHEVFIHGDRYEWRSQGLADATRINGRMKDLRVSDTDLVASWREADFMSAVGEVIDEAVMRALAAHPGTELAPIRIASRITSPLIKATQERETQVALLRNQAATAQTEADNQRKLASVAAGAGLADEATRSLEAAVAAQRRADDLRNQAEELEARPLVADEPPPPQLDISTAAAVVAALRSPSMTGAQDRRFADAVRSFLSEPGGLRLEVIPNDWLHVKLTGQIAVQTTAGVLTVPVDKVVTAKLPDTNADARIHELARLRMCESFTYEQLLVPARSNDTVALRRQLIDYIGAGERQPSPDPVTRKSQPFATRGAVIPEPGLRAAAVDAIPEVRQIIWKAITAASNRGTLTTFEKHINAVYRSEGLRWAATWAWEAETKFKALAIVLSRPEFIEHGMRTVDLAACLSMEVRAVNQISERSRINHRVHPPCLSRPGGWGGYGSGNLVDDDRRVSVLRCERPGCDGLMNALLPVPEVLALDAMVVCSTCARAAAGSNKLRFPTFYLDWAALRLAQFQGDWVPCAAPGCTADTGAGPGMTWAWASSDCDPMHDACRPGASLRRRRGRPPRAAQAR